MPEQIEETLKSFEKIDKVLGTMLLNSVGKILAKTVTQNNQMENNWEQEIFNCLHLGEQLGTLLQLGKLTQSYLEYPDLNFTSETIKDKQDETKLLIIISQDGVNLGRIRMEIRKVKKILEEITV